MSSPNDPISPGESIVNKLLKDAQNKNTAVDVLKERESEYAKAVEQICSSEAGRFAFKYILKYCKVFTTEPLNTALLVEDGGKRKVYLEMIRPYLSHQTRSQLEE